MVSYGLRKPRKNLMRNLTYILTLIVLVGCSGEQSTGLDEDVLKEKKYNWRLVTSWPKNYPGLGMAPERIADLVEEMSNGADDHYCLWCRRTSSCFWCV